MSLENNFNNLELKDIIDFVKNKQEENLNLDFKTINKSNLSNKDDKKNLAKAISGFANSNGGLIIWGVEARKDKDGIDCACGYKPIDNVKLFLSRLNELTSRATIPPVEGIGHKPFIDNGKEGYVVTYIPECDAGPIMAKLSEDRYYKRSGDTFYKMEHYDIADMFGKRKKPNLFVIGRYFKDGNTHSIIISLKNIGRGIAKFPYLAFNCPSPFQVSSYGLDGNYNTGLPKIINPSSIYQNQFGGGSDHVIYPEMSIDITKLIIKIGDNVQIPDKVNIDYEIVADGFRNSTGEVEIDISS